MCMTHCITYEDGFQCCGKDNVYTVDGYRNNVILFHNLWGHLSICSRFVENTFL